VSVAIWFWGRLPHVVKRIYPSRSIEEARPAAEKAWDAQFAWLEAYQVVHGDCNVPKRWVEDQPLATWAHHQRQSKKKFDRNGSGMTAARVERLSQLGFAWAPDDILWGVHFARLEAYQVVHGDCNVPQRLVEDQPLATWANHQRESKKKFDRNGSGMMTAARVERLSQLGFAWAPQRGWKRKVWSTLCKPPVV
jgi:hypothetical protein